MDDDKKKRHINFTVIAFCGTIAIYMLLAAMFSSGVGIGSYFIAFIVAALVAGATFGAAYILDP